MPAPTKTVRLGRVSHAWPGDKGSTANIGVIALKPEYYPDCGNHPPKAHTAGRNRSRCLNCDAKIVYPTGSPPEHRLFAIEYHLPEARPIGLRKGRLFKAPDTEDLAKFAEANETLCKMRPQYVPDDAIPKGDETERLHRWGYRHYRELFNNPQLLGLELSCRWISEHPDEHIQEALASPRQEWMLADMVQETVEAYDEISF
jgi:putative DNA methylase